MAKIKKTKIDHIEIILFCPDLIKQRKKNSDPLELFNNLNVDGLVKKSVLFLKLDNALQYGRFMKNSHGLLRAYVPHHAIEGRTNGLTIKQGALAKKHIHGVYPGDKKGMIYIKNPEFS